MEIIHNATVVTVDADDTILFDGGVAIDGNKIVEVGPSAAVLEHYANANRIDGANMAVMPGFANVHTISN